MQASKTNQLDDVLSRFGNAQYSESFWKAVNTSIRQEQESFERQEREAAIASQKQLRKQYTL
ncbi:MAG TPA: hypothetical protein VLM37_13245 [Fibrobacteraceae bacterium]|nr:hypothetical protein [Fibrobacteraceae bacterium]